MSFLSTLAAAQQSVSENDALAAAITTNKNQTISAFKVGIQAFNRGEYARALSSFLQEENTGNASGQLIYNIASTYVKLHQYSEAEHYYSRLLENNKWGDLAFFNLALIAEHTGRNEEAVERFSHVVKNAKNEKLRRVAVNKIDKLTSHSEIDTQLSQQATRENTQVDDVNENASYGLLSITSGYDDNVITLSNDLQTGTAEAGDMFFEHFAFASTSFDTAHWKNARFQGFLYKRTYDDFASYDITVADFGLLVNDYLEQGWSRERGLNISVAKIAGDTAYKQLLAQYAWMYSGEWGSVEITYSPSYYFAGIEYAHLQGWEHGLSSTFNSNLQGIDIAIKVGVDFNARENADYEDERFSYSPLRHSVTGSAQWYPLADLMLKAQVYYADSAYAGKNLQLDIDGEIKEKQRKANVLCLTLSTNYTLSAKTSMQATYQYVENRENFDVYTYKRNEFSIGVDYAF